MLVNSTINPYLGVIMRSTKAVIHLNNLISNYKLIKKQSKNAAICAVVKSNGYGHGAVQVAKTLEILECNFFGVSTIYEGEELINAGIKKPVIIFSLPTPEEIPYVVKLNLEPLVTTSELINLFNAEAQKKKKIVNIHLKVDTGMGRIGCKPESVLYLANQIKNSTNLNLKGLCTHFSTSEDNNKKYTENQLQIFEEVISELKNNNINPQFIHAANSGAILNHKTSIFNLVRTGISLYGYPPLVNANRINLYKPVMELKSKIVELKEVPKETSISYGRKYITKNNELIATIPIGYADGYFRQLSNKAEVYIKGKRYPVIGNICMDQLMVRVDKNISLYDEVILIGVNKNEPNAEELATYINTISYEILTNIHRVKRFYNK